MASKLYDRVRRRAENCCEYCRLPQAGYVLTFEVDHIVAQQHRGKTEYANLALACPRCNAHKGTNLAGIDPDAGELTRLFHPRGDDWTEHFRWSGPYLEGLTDVGRVTVQVLDMNHPDAVKLREALMEEGVFPK